MAMTSHPHHFEPEHDNAIYKEMSKHNGHKAVRRQQSHFRLSVM